LEVKKVAILMRGGDEPPLLDRHVAEIEATVPGVKVGVGYEEAALLAGDRDADVLLTWGTLAPVDFCRAAPRLRWIHAFTTGVDGLLGSEIRTMGFTITTTKGIHGSIMADHVLALIFAFVRALPALFRQQEARVFVKRMEAGETAGKTVGIVGLGRIGQEIGRRTAALGMRVVGLRHRSELSAPWLERLYGEEERDAFLGAVDFLVLTVPLTPETQHLIGARELSRMRPSAYLINVARGGVVDTEALVAALRQGVIAGAGLDVFEEEPLPPESPLWELPNVIVTPHMAAVSSQYMDRAIEVFVENLRRYTRGEPLLYTVDPMSGY
jgi:phosphoglycerate dehydrogenase-like enzyme